MYKFLFTTIFVFFCLFVLPGGAFGAEFYVSTTAALQTALTTSEANSEADTIKVVQGLYNGKIANHVAQDIDMVGGTGYGQPIMITP